MEDTFIIQRVGHYDIKGKKTWISHISISSLTPESSCNLPESEMLLKYKIETGDWGLGILQWAEY